MAIDMTTVKAISYNNKDVVKIEDSNANVLWQKVRTRVLSNYITIPYNVFIDSVTTTGNQRINFKTNTLDLITNYVATQLGVSASDIDTYETYRIKISCYCGYLGSSYYYPVFSQLSSTGSTLYDVGIWARKSGSELVGNSQNLIVFSVPAVDRTHITGTMYGYTFSSSSSNKPSYSSYSNMTTSTSIRLNSSTLANSSAEVRVYYYTYA